MPWILIATFLFNGEPMVMSDNIFYDNKEQCQAAVKVRKEVLDATRPEYMAEAQYWVWCSQIPQEV